MTFKQRVEPFLALIEARYAPLLFVALPQAYAVYLWLLDSGAARGSENFTFAVLGAAGFELVYVGTIAWAEGRTNNQWVWGTALTALIFSVMVSIRVYQNEGWWSILHAGFPIVAFAYTMTIHAAAKKREEGADPSAIKILGDTIVVQKNENLKLQEALESHQNEAITLRRSLDAELKEREITDKEVEELRLENSRLEVELERKEEELQYYSAEFTMDALAKVPEPPEYRIVPAIGAGAADSGAPGLGDEIRDIFRSTGELRYMFEALQAGVRRNTIKQWHKRYAKDGVRHNGEVLTTWPEIQEVLDKKAREAGVEWS